MTQPPYPQQPPPYWPQQQQAWPGQQQQQQPGYPAAPQQPVQYQLPQGAPPVPPAYQVDEAAVRAAYDQAKQDSGGGGGGLPWFKFLPPDGFQSWKQVGAGTERTHNVWFCQPWAGSSTFFHKYSKHFYKYAEAGLYKSSGIDCLGDQCLFCESAKLASQNPNLAQSVENWRKIKTRYLYNVLDLDIPQLHMREDGGMQPLILDASPTLNEDIDAMVGPQGLGMVTALFDPQVGRPARLTKKKTGNEDINIEYSAQYAPNPSPLPQQFLWALQNLHDLSQTRKRPTPENYQEAIVRLQWPVPQMQVHSPSMQAPQPPAAYNPAPQPPAPSPYPPAMAPPPPPAVPPQEMAPYPTPQAMAPPPPPPIQPGQPAPGWQAGAPPPVAPQAPPPLVGGAPGGGMSMTGTGLPPPMSPPPMTTTGVPDAGAYAPPPGAAPPGAAPPAPAGQPPPGVPGDTKVPFNQAAASPTRTLLLDPTTGKLPEGTRLDDEGRERCFGKHAEADQMCKECPDWIKSQCIPQTPGAQVQAHDPELASLQSQLEGTPS